MKAKEIIDEIDTILARLEDFTHGEDGKDITKARKLLIDLEKEIEKE